MGHLINVLTKYIQGLFSRSGDSHEEKPSSILLPFPLPPSLSSPNAFISLPPDITVVQVVSAFIVFLLVVVFALRVLNYFKIL